MKEALDWMIGEWHRIGYGWFAIFDKSSRAFVGQVGLQCFEYDPQSAETELAFVIKKIGLGQGVLAGGGRGGPEIRLRAAPA
jgi:RimJ/RimL family protein N-acetyltransferase